MAIQQFKTAKELRHAIQQLEIKIENEWPPLKKQLLATAESLKPKHLLKDTLREVFFAPGLKATAVNTTLGLAAVLAANFIFPSKTTSQLTKLITGSIVGITALRKVVSSGIQIKSVGNSLFKKRSVEQSAL